MEESCPHHTTLLHSKCTVVSKGNCSWELKDSGYSCALQVCILRSGTFIPSFLIWVLRCFSSTFSQASLWRRGRREKTWKYVSPLWHSTQCFCTRRPSSTDFRVHSISGAFCLGLSQQWDVPHIYLYWSIWTSTSALFHGGKWNRAVRIFSSFRLLLIPLQ